MNTPTQPSACKPVADAPANPGRGLSGEKQASAALAPPRAEQEDLAAPPVTAGGTRERVLVGLLLLLLTGVYAAGAAYLSGFHAFWSPDSGARLAMIRNWREYGSMTAFHDGHAPFDPDGHLQPLTFYLLRGERGFTTIYQPLFPWLSGLLFGAFGFGGLTVLPVLAGAGTAAAGYATARLLALRCRLIFPVALGLATPLAVYSVVFWEHSILMLLTAIAGYFLARALDGGPRNGGRLAAAAGASLGAGVWFHELFLGLFASVLLTGCLSLPRGTRGRLLGGLAAGFAPLLALWVAGNCRLYGMPVGPHLSGSTKFAFQGHVVIADEWPARTAGPHSLLRLLDLPHAPRRALLQLVGSEDPDAVGRSLFLLLLVTTLIAWRGGRLRPAAAPLCAAASVVAVLPLSGGTPWLNGLFEATPALIPALCAPWSPRPLLAEGDRAGLFLPWIGRACVMFSLIVLLNPVVPGLEWGSRYLLTVLPWLALLAASTFEGWYLSSGPRWRRAAALAIVASIGLSVYSQASGLRSVRGSLAYAHALNLRAQRVTSPLLVTDTFWLGAELTPSRLRQDQWLVRSAADRRAFLDALPHLDAAEFTYMGGVSSPDSPGALARSVAHGPVPYAPTASWEGDGLRFMRFVRRAPHALVPRRVLALYYPWYGTPLRSGRWLHQAPALSGGGAMADHADSPLSGPYDSTDSAVIERHLRQARAAGIDTLVCSWWGQGSGTDGAIRRLLARAPAHGMRVCVLWEQLAPPGDARAAASDLAYLVTTLGRQPGYLHRDGRPVVFLFAKARHGLPASDWGDVLNGAALESPPGASVIADDSEPDDLLLWDGECSLSPTYPPAGAPSAHVAPAPGLLAQARRYGDVSLETVEPGYDDRRVMGPGAGTYTDRGGGRLYRTLWRHGLRDGPDWVLINSFNQWHDGTEIEPSVEYGDRYLALTRRLADRFRQRTPPGRRSKDRPGGTESRPVERVGG